MKVFFGKNPIRDLIRGEDYMPLNIPGGRVEIAARCVLAGYGITSSPLHFDEYRNINARGKVVIVFSGMPWRSQTGRWLDNAIGDHSFGTIAYKASNAASHGAVGLLVVDNPAGWRKEVGIPERLKIPDRKSYPECPIPVIQVTRKFLTSITTMSEAELHMLASDIERDGESHSMELRGRHLTFTASIAGSARLGRNIVAVLPGSDNTLRRQAVVIGAHYDHLGADEEAVYFGADDNAAGCGAVLAVARAFATLPARPKRTLVFLAFDAEEIGRLGSRFYVEKPAVPMNQTVFMINFDMIGRGEPNHINAVGTRSSPALHQLHQEVNRVIGLRLTHPESFRLGRSDHSAFYYAGVPIMYLFGGLHHDYNTPEDTWDKLIPEKVERVARLAFLTALEVAEMDVPPPFRHNDVAEPQPFGSGRG